MFSGKTTALQTAAKDAILADRVILYLIPDVDTRYDASLDAPLNRSHDNLAIRAQRIHGSLEHVDAPNDVEYIFIDEAHFVHGIEAYALRQRARGKHVHLACLRSDYRGNPWPNTNNLIAVHADVVTLHTAVCLVCQSGDALYTRLKHADHTAPDAVLIGGDETYASVCSAHFKEPAVLDSALFVKRANALARIRQVSQ